jgi:hypothetical protein
MSRDERSVNRRRMRTTLLLLLVCGCGPVFVKPVSTSEKGLGIAASPEPPAIMFLLDRSGSMAEPIDSSTGCSCLFPGCNETSCPTRMGQVRAWASAMLADLGEEARWGLTLYPADALCGPPSAKEVLVQIGASGGGASVNARIQQVTVQGGTPTSAALGFVGGAFPNDSAERIILLVTDGLPNCDPFNPNTCLNPAACQCTIGSSCGSMLNDGDPMNNCRRGCLDRDHTLDALDALSGFGVHTLVVGFGLDVAQPSAVAMMNELSQAGSGAQHCVAGSDCVGGSTCVAGTCVGNAMFGLNAVELGGVTAALRRKVDLSTRCRWTLSEAVEPSRLHAYLGDEAVPAGDVALELPRRVKLFGSTCRRLLDNPDLAPSFFDAAP